MNNLAIAGLVLTGALALVIYIFLFPFLSGSKNSGGAYDKFVMEICCPKGDDTFLQTLLSWGYFKRSFKNFVRHYRLKLFPVPSAQLGKRCPDCQVVTLDGKVKSLLKDYLEVDSDLPIVINLGSYT